MKDSRQTNLKNNPGREWYVPREDFLRNTTWLSIGPTTDSLCSANGLDRRICKVYGVVAHDKHFLSVRGDYGSERQSNFVNARIRFQIQSPRLDGHPELDEDFEKAIKTICLLVDIVDSRKNDISMVVAPQSDGSARIEFSHSIFEQKKVWNIVVLCHVARVAFLIHLSRDDQARFTIATDPTLFLVSHLIYCLSVKSI